MHFTKGLWERVPTVTKHTTAHFIHKKLVWFETRPVFFSEGTETVSFYLIWPHYHEKSLSHKVDGTECRWAKLQPSAAEGNWVGATGAPLQALSSGFVVLSSASERPEKELFQCRNLGVLVTKDSSVKAKQGKLSVEMTDQPFVTKWTCLLTRSSFWPVRRLLWLRKTPSVQHKST